MSCWFLMIKGCLAFGSTNLPNAVQGSSRRSAVQADNIPSQVAPRCLSVDADNMRSKQLPVESNCIYYYYRDGPGKFDDRINRYDLSNSKVESFACAFDREAISSGIRPFSIVQMLLNYCVDDLPYKSDPLEWLTNWS